MPQLTWPTKSISTCPPAKIKLESNIYPNGAGYPNGGIENYLYWGDNLRIMSGLLNKYEGKIDLIYADPPFFTNKEFKTRIGRDEDSRRPMEWQLAEGYGDRWDDLDAYLDFLYPRLDAMVKLLSERGTLYLHLDWHADACARLLLDELLGRENLINEIIWVYHGPSPITRAFNRKHDVILAYSKSKTYTFNSDAIREPYNQNTVKTFRSSPKAGFGKIPNLARGKIPEDWWYFPVVARLHSERTGYPTQKPEALLERIILASSNPGDIVADFFCGSGTFPFIATKNERRFLASDNSWRAIHTAHKRMAISGSKPFSIYNEGQSGKNVLKPSFSLSFNRETSELEIIPNLDSDSLLDYWEVDPDWNGDIFQSVLQVAREARSSDIPLKIKLPFAAKNVCVRAVTPTGEKMELHVQPVSNASDGPD
jgi:DNA modification methylase